MTYFFPNFEPVICAVFGSVASWLVYKSFRRQVRRSYSHISKNFPQFVMIHTVKSFGVVNKAEEDVFLERPSSKSLQAINAGEGVEKRDHSYTVGGNAN